MNLYGFACLVAAVEPTARVSGAIWAQTPPKDGVIENIVLLVDDDEDGLTCNQMLLQTLFNSEPRRIDMSPP